jgi:hypothetical protein
MVTIRAWNVWIVRSSVYDSFIQQVLTHVQYVTHRISSYYMATVCVLIGPKLFLTDTPQANVGNQHSLDDPGLYEPSVAGQKAVYYDHRWDWSYDKYAST